MEIRQYEVVLLNLEPTIGSEMKKTRQCVVLSPNEMNKYLQTIVIAPFTSSSKPYPTRIEITQEVIKGWIVIDQIRTVDRIRIIKSLGYLTEKEIDNVMNVIKETYVD
ncbi:MAG: growth inhibitor PemK [Bacteroidetes bacterium GWF2_40_14]|nr:MAG: growth inhibitor PemK [Bacteroidetes bacterium GWF2_40_14]